MQSICQLARWLAASDDFAADILLSRHHDTSQAGFSFFQQQKNVAGIFIVTPISRANLFGKLLRLIGDVMATRATLNAAAAYLPASGRAPTRGIELARILQKSKCALWMIVSGHKV